MFFGVYEFDLLLVQNYDLVRRFDAHFVPEQISKSTGPITVILHMFSKVSGCAFSGFWTLTLKSSTLT